MRHERGFCARSEYLRLNPVRQGLVEKPEQWPWSSTNNFALEQGAVEGCPMQMDYARLPVGYRA